MALLLVALFLLQAGAPMGTVTGIVRSSPGIPAAGVRVYAQQVRDPADPNSPAAPLEGLAQTDASGRYRLELAAGRYYIASGSVSAPTYYPGTTTVASAKTVTVTPGGVVDGIDFGSFVAANRTLLSTLIVQGVLTGTVRFPDGSPAANIRVAAFPSSAPLPQTSAQLAETDAAGRYRISNVPSGSLYIVAGFMEASGFHTGGANSTQPKAIVAAPATTIDSLDIIVPFPPARTGTTVSGQVLTKDGVPAAGVTVQIVSPKRSTVTGVVLPSINAVPDTVAEADGTFRFTNVVPGFYNVRVSLSRLTKFEVIDVGNSPVTGLQFSLPAAIFSGRILLEDGSLISDPELFVRGVLTLSSNPNMLLSTLLPISVNGTFAGLPDIGESRFYFENLPEEYEIRAITAGSVDLMKEPARFDGTKSFLVDVRVARRNASRVVSSARVVGTAVDGSGAPSAATRVQLCCSSSNVLESLSAPLRPDGSFEFADVPPGTYRPQLRVKAGQTAIRVMSATVEGETDRVKLKLLSGPGTAGTSATIEIPKR